MIYFHAMLHHLMIMNEYADQFPPLEKGHEGFVFCSVIQTVSQSLSYTKKSLKVEDIFYLSSVFWLSIPNITVKY